MWQFLLLWTVSVIPLSGRSIWHGLFLFSIFLHFPIDFLFADFSKHLESQMPEREGHGTLSGSHNKQYSFRLRKMTGIQKS